LHLFLREIALAGQVDVHQRSTGWSLWIGTGLIALGVLVSLVASFEYLLSDGLEFRQHDALLPKHYRHWG
jgi:hypothetical protein